ncbi:MAG: HEAT repeat domain-containing protein [Planctomycetaceae bacterium]|nr:HEAT repeat domain-containing protein [Planctomycetaceae bacterium]
MIAWILAALLAQDPTAPQGWTIRKVAESTFPMFATFDDRGRLYVTESSGGDLYLELQNRVRGCRIRRFEDRDGDGVFETSTVFAEGLAPSMGIAWRDGKIYAADPPDVATYEDLDDDGKADRRRVILTGFGHRDNGSLHGLVFGPDGLLYMTTGEPDGYTLTGRDGKKLSGVSGALLRCRPDGSDVEVIARGFENLVEVVFLPGGDILGTCNWYQKPEGGIRDAIVHLVDGGLYPYCPDQGTAYPVTGEVLPPLALFPAVALSGFVRSDADGSLYSAQHNTRQVVRHVLTRKGSTYAAESVDFVRSENPDFHPSDVLEDRDGSLLVLDTGAWYVQHCPTGRIRKSPAPGGIWRVRPTAKPAGKRAEPARIPVGLSPELLQKWLPDPAASRALARLAKPEAAAALVDVLNTGDAPQRLAAAEALATCGGADSLPAIWAALAADPDPFLEHALIHAALRVSKGQLPSDLPAHPRVRKAALLIRDQTAPGLRPEELLPHLGSADADLRRAALRILQKHRDWAPLALKVVDERLQKAELGDDDRALLRTLILAFQSDAGLQRKVGAALDRAFVLEAVAETTLPRFPETWKPGLAAALTHQDPDVRFRAVRAVATLGLVDHDALLTELSANPAEAAATRFEALRSLIGRRPVLSSAALDFLLNRVAAGADALPRLAAAEILRRATLDDAVLARVLKAIRGDSLIAPSLFLPGLARAGAPALDEAAQSIRQGWRPSVAELGPLLERLPGDVRALLRNAAEEQSAKLAQFEPLLKGGDAARGREVFYGKKVACGTCHRVGSEGGRVGPDLTKVGAIRAGRDLLESILVPSSTFAQGYEPYLALSKDGAVYSGLIARQSPDAVTLRDAAGAEVQLRRDRLEQLKRAEKSIMPEGLERALSPDEFRDLLAFLQGLK